MTMPSLFPFFDKKSSAKKDTLKDTAKRFAGKLSTPPFTYCLDFPKPNEPIGTSLVTIRGWIAAKSPIERPVLKNAEGTVSQPLVMVSRPDVEADYPQDFALGFQTYISVIDLLRSQAWQIQFVIDNQSYHIPVDFTISPQYLAELQRKSCAFQPFSYQIDSPSFNEEVTSKVIGFRGWIVADGPIENPILRNAGSYRKTLETIARPDVAADYPHQFVLGFQHPVSVKELVPGEAWNWSIHFSIHGRAYQFLIPFSMSQQAFDLSKHQSSAGQPFKCIIESPIAEQEITTSKVLLKGWITSFDFPLKEPALCNASQEHCYPLETINRPDVLADYPHQYILGFQKEFLARDLAADHAWFLRFFLDDQEQKFPIHFSVSRKILLDETLEKKPIPPFEYWIDSPALNAVINKTFVVIRGWIVSKSPLSELTLRNTGTHIYPLALEDRPDVAVSYPGQYVTGYRHFLPITVLNPQESWSVHFQLDNQDYSFSIPFSISPQAFEEFWTKKQQKLQKILPVLRCPVCAHETLEYTPETIQCPNCSSSFKSNEIQYNFLTPDLIEYGAVKSTANISANGYDHLCQELIKKNPDGLILDNGCGLRDYYHNTNVVNFEIVEYPSTDVVGIGEKLPFKSNVFDVVFSFAVLEHVRNPFECAKEIIRVLKPGGLLYIQVPFLQPFHGYPDHYYNMTSSGLKNLFEKEIEIIESGVQDVGAPIWCLSWFLNSYIKGLPADVAENFKQLKVADLIAHPMAYLEQDFVTQLSESVKDELASVTYLVGKKM